MSRPRKFFDAELPDVGFLLDAALRGIAVDGGGRKLTRAERRGGRALSPQERRYMEKRNRKK